MIIESLVVENFRNYQKENLGFSPSLNFFVGENAAGKTNLLEAIGYFLLYRSFREVKDFDLIRTGENYFYIKIDVINSKGEKATYEVGVEKRNQQLQKKIKKNGKNVKKISEIITDIIGVFFLPEDIDYADSIPKRRTFFDYLFSILDSDYLKVLNDYQKTLKQRNELLRRIIEKKGNYQELDIWDERLINYSLVIMEKRINYLRDFQKYFERRITEISDSKDEISVELEQPDLETFKEGFLNNRYKDLKMGTTTMGVHRDKFLFLDKRKRKDISFTFSQGQKRTCVISMKLAKNDLLTAKYKKPPILFIDDVFRELDSKRRTYFIKSIGEVGQAFFTIPAISEEIAILERLKGQKGKVFEIQNGVVMNEY
ncbi:MAG: DNA replication and repair protein RecF [Leptospiraceae bacterium]|nr:DNA replication and repair protein RecF [Leptospiraceae bacterium]MDW7976237.1 DNA replication and repair protein RecF [Leptospiraceae bacterium]